MANPLEFTPVLSHTGQIRQGQVLDFAEGRSVRVQLAGTTQVVECQILYSGTTGLTLSESDAVLVWLQDIAGTFGVVLGRIGPYVEAPQPVVATEEFADRPQTLLLEAQGDVVLRNGQAKVKLGAQGDIEIVGASVTARSRRLLRLLAPFIKLN